MTPYSNRYHWRPRWRNFRKISKYWQVIALSKLYDPIENDLTFHSRQNLVRYDDTLKFYGVLSKIHHFSIGRKSQLQPPIKNLVFLHRFFGIWCSFGCSTRWLYQIRPSIVFKMALNLCEIEPPCHTKPKNLSFFLDRLKFPISSQFRENRHYSCKNLIIWDRNSERQASSKKKLTYRKDLHISL